MERSEVSADFVSHSGQKPKVATGGTGSSIGHAQSNVLKLNE